MSKNEVIDLSMDSDSEIELEIFSENEELSEEEQGPFLDRFTALESLDLRNQKNKSIKKNFFRFHILLKNDF